MYLSVRWCNTTPKAPKAEVILFDGESQSASGLLNKIERKNFANHLREIADELEAQ